jgi:hypothetical protein
MNSFRFGDTASIMSPILMGIGSFAMDNPLSMFFGFLTILLGFLGALLSVYDKVQRVNYNKKRLERIERLSRLKAENQKSDFDGDKL